MNFLREIREIEEVELIDYVGAMFDQGRPRGKRKVYRLKKNLFEEYTAEEFHRMYRFSKEGARALVEAFGENLSPEIDGRVKLSSEFQILTALRCWGRNMMQDDCADLHGLSQQSVTFICGRVAKAIATTRPNYVYMPRTAQEESQAANLFSSINGFKNVIGCIDCTHIRIHNLRTDVGKPYLNGEGFHSMNVQVVCDATLKFQDIVARWPGSVDNARIFNESRLKRRFEAGEFRGRLLGDSGYPCTPYLFTPVCNPRDAKEEAYNTSHKSTHNTIERCFALWKSRFRCLQTGFRTVEEMKVTVVALAVLHNFAIMLKEREFPIEEPEPVVEEQNPCGTAVRAEFIQHNF